MAMVKPKTDPKKVIVIIQVLAKYPDGIWLRRLARETKLNPMTITRYVNGSLSNLVEESSLGNAEAKPLMRIVRLKPLVLDRLRQGDTIKKVLRLAGFLEGVNK